MFRAYKTQVYPNNSQLTKIRKNFGAARWAYNFAIQKKKEAFENKAKTPNNIELHREINKLKGTEVLPWAYDDGISKCSFQEALRDCDTAFSNFFRNCKKKKSGRRGFPKFKSKRDERQSFRLYGAIKILDGGFIKLPRIGKIKLSEVEYLPMDAKILSATVSNHSDKIFVSIQVEENDKTKTILNTVIGVDLGIKTLATCSDGTVFENPKALKKNLKKLKRKQRQLSRKKKGSNNREKSKVKLRKLHSKISNIRKDALHKATSKIVNKNQVIVIEDLSISNMMKNHKLAQAIGDASFGEFRRQIEYKAKWNGRTVIIADRFFPSSKMDHKSSKINKDLKLSDRVIYHEDGTETDRDLNAAINLKNYYLKQNTVSSTGINASGERSSFDRETGQISCSVKEEFNGDSIVCENKL